MVFWLYIWFFLCWFRRFPSCQSSQLSCNGPDHCVKLEFTQPRSGKRLVGYNFQNETTSQHMKCTDHCSMNCLCISVNIRPLQHGNVLCELNYEDDQTANVSLHDETSYQYTRQSITDIQCKVRMNTIRRYEKENKEI